MLTSTSMRWLVVAVSAAMLLAVAAACSSETIEVPGETVVVEKEVIKEVMVPGETVVVEKIVTETVEVPGETVTVEVVKTVEVPGETVVVEKEVVKEVQVPGETVVVEKEVVKEVPAGYVTDPSTGKVVSAPEYGGTLTITTWGVGANTDPLSSGGAGVAISNVTDQLLIPNWAVDRDEYAFSSQYVPVEVATGQLAESWDFSPDGLTYTFKIRQGVHWHNKPPMNGRELTAEDVEYNYHRVLGLGSGFTEPGSYVGPLASTAIFESVEATDNWTVVFKLKERSLSAFPGMMTDNQAAILPPEVIKEHGDVQDWRNLVGTGPYEMTDWVEGSSITYNKNPDYWGFDEKYPENRLPYVDQIQWLIIPEQATRIAGLRAGRIDFMGFAAGSSRDIKSVDIIDNLRSTNPELELFKWWDRAENAYGLDVNKPPFDDVRVRKAMQMALDLKTISDTHYKGTSSWEPQGILGEALIGYYVPFDEWPDEVKAGYAYNPEGARQLLAEAGYPDGFEMVLNHYAAWDLGYTEIVAGYWKEIGVDVNIRKLGRKSVWPSGNGARFGRSHYDSSGLE